MANRRKKSDTTRAKRKTAIARQPEAPESQAAEAVTVAWTLSVMTVTGCNLGTAALWFFVREHPEHEMLVLLSGMLYFAAVCIGFVSLVLLPFVCRVRRVLPPRGMIYFGLLVASAPIITLVVQSFRR
ncbi:MAG: hypothetical protein KDA42_06575 [Planctomycetales bacterium]|nr:hypothetical protein [Planctomycetales bacterium]